MALKTVRFIALACLAAGASALPALADMQQEIDISRCESAVRELPDQRAGVLDAALEVTRSAEQTIRDVKAYAAFEPPACQIEGASGCTELNDVISNIFNAERSMNQVYTKFLHRRDGLSQSLDNLQTRCIDKGYVSITGSLQPYYWAKQTKEDQLVREARALALSERMRLDEMLFEIRGEDEDAY